MPLFQNESKCETFHMKMSSVCSAIFMQIKVIRMVSDSDSQGNLEKVYCSGQSQRAHTIYLPNQNSNQVHIAEARENACERVTIGFWFYF